ncbi:L-threonine-O-3-phosphate decarboxylase [Desulfosarcina cetonica]|uniref:pyridoxal phosphate-dependent aminotransferase n=1 Tax=Desulfosarcina cetonica TaxID=90730 RepID=UPI0006CFC456|nr:threonine-phosphate decarboxylase [Desulfosarcina cetonica]VTR65855.1 L-threonine-O-3-phosphate decarboxylase [Desulfosarcina cetonica]
MIGGHGGNIYHLARIHGCRPSDICDMSANVNPLGPMPDLMDHLAENLPVITALPEVDAGSMIAAFARQNAIDPQTVMAGNGSTQLIYRIPRALGSRRAIVVGPTYADYHDACVMHGVACEHLICREADDFVPDTERIREAAAGADLVFLCNPNNPTGAMADREAITDLCRALPETVFVIDESYLPFVPQPETISMIRSELPNVLVLNSMSKAFRIPGLRIGFVKAPPPLMTKLAAYALPWSVNSLAQAAVTWLMTHADAVDAFLSETRTLIAAEKPKAIARLHASTAIRCFPSATTFILMRLPAGLDAPTVWQQMADQRILVRDCANFQGLSDAFIRISLKNLAENQRAIDLLVDLCRRHENKGAAHAG